MNYFTHERDPKGTAPPPIDNGEMDKTKYEIRPGASAISREEPVPSEHSNPGGLSRYEARSGAILLGWPAGDDFVHSYVPYKKCITDSGFSLLYHEYSPMRLYQGKPESVPTGVYVRLRKVTTRYRRPNST